MNTQALLLLLATALTKYATDLLRIVWSWYWKWHDKKRIEAGKAPMLVPALEGKALNVLTVPLAAVLTVGCFYAGGYPIKENLMFALVTALGATGYHEGMSQLKKKSGLDDA